MMSPSLEVTLELPIFSGHSKLAKSNELVGSPSKKEGSIKTTYTLQ